MATTEGTRTMPMSSLPAMSRGIRLRPLLLAGATAAALLPAQAALAASGRFSPAISWPFIPIHAALMPDGKVATFGATPTNEHGGYTYDIWDPARGTDAAAHLTLPNGTSANTFCAGQVLLPYNGQVMVTGGNTPQESSQIDYQSQRLTSLTPTTFQRWYATLTTLPDGRVMVNGGIPPYGTWQDASTTAEIFTPGAGWKTLPGTAVATSKIGGDENRYRYPRVFPIAGNKVFAVSGKALYTVSYDGNGATSAFTPFAKPNFGGSSSAAMYRPGLVLQVGGGAGENDIDGPAGSTGATVIDLRGATPAVRDTAPMRFGRHWPTTTVLPTGEVLVTGGSTSNNGYGYTAAGAALTAEIWSPDAGTWRSDAVMAKPRLYHSVALLLPSGQVYVGGGGSPGPVDLKDAELYTPGYLLDDRGQPLPRPAITAAPGRIALGKAFRIEADKPVARVTLLKTGAVTHGFNMDQRFFELPFKADGKGADVTMTADAVNATPGFYMVFAFDAAGVPSPGRIVKLPSPIGDDGRAAPQPGTPAQPTTPTTPSTPTAATDLPPQQPSPLALAGSQTCLAPAGTTNASRVGTAGACGAGTWTFRSVGSERYAISFGNLCLDTGASGAPGSPAEMWSCDNSKEQSWGLLAGRSTGTRMIVSSSTGLCLAAGSDATLRQEVCVPTSAAQSWQVPGAAPATPAPTTPSTPATPSAGWAAATLPQPFAAPLALAGAATCAAPGSGRTMSGTGACDASAWTLRPLGTDRYVVATGGNLCLDTGASGAAGTSVELWPCDNSAEQVWRLGSVSGAGQTLASVRTGLCLDASNPVALRQQACSTAAAGQRWQARVKNTTSPTTPPTPASPSAFPPAQPAVLAVSASASCLQPKDGKAGNGVAAAVGACGAAPSWTFRARGTNRYVLASGNRCLDVGAAGTAGSAAELWSCDGSEEQVWTLATGASGTKLKAARSGLCLDGGDGATVRQIACDMAKPAQDWATRSGQTAASN